MRKNKKLVMALSITLALATIIAGSTFAWFTSKDQVVNHLQTSKLTDGDVSIIETFDPDDQLEPGVAVNKQAGAINTGSTDALVRMSFEEALQKLVDGKEIFTLNKWTAADSDYIPQIVNLDAYSGWKTLGVSTTEFGTLTGDDLINFNTLTAAGITVVYKQTTGAGTAANPYKYSFAAYADLDTTPDTYQRVELLPEAFNVDNGNLTITLVDPSVPASTDVEDSYYRFVKLELDNFAEADWTVKKLTKAFASLTESSNIVTPNLATESITSDVIYLIFGNNVITTLTNSAADEGKWYYNAADGWFYYLGVLQSGESTGDLLKQVYMLQEAGNEYAYTTFDLTVNMDGIQAVKDAVTSTSGWGLTGTLANTLRDYCTK